MSFLPSNHCVNCSLLSFFCFVCLFHSFKFIWRYTINPYKAAFDFSPLHYNLVSQTDKHKTSRYNFQCFLQPHYRPRSYRLQAFSTAPVANTGGLDCVFETMFLGTVHLRVVVVHPPGFMHNWSMNFESHNRFHSSNLLRKVVRFLYTFQPQAYTHATMQNCSSSVASARAEGEDIPISLARAASDLVKAIC